MLDTITNNPNLLSQAGWGNLFCLKCDDSMVPITPLRLVTILLLTLQIQNEPVNEPVNDNSKPFFLQRNKIHP